MRRPPRESIEQYYQILATLGVPLAIHEESYGKDHPNVTIERNSLARLLLDTSRLAEAEPLYRRAVEIDLEFTRATGHAHPHFRAAFANYAGLLIEMGHTPQKIAAELVALAKPYGINPAASLFVPLKRMYRRRLHLDRDRRGVVAANV